MIDCYVPPLFSIIWRKNQKFGTWRQNRDFFGTILVLWSHLVPSGPPEKFVHNLNGRAVFHEKWESSTLYKSGGHSIVREKISLRAGHSPSSDKNPATGFSLEEVFLAQAGLQVHSPPDRERSGALQQQQRRFPCWAEHCQVAGQPLQCCSTYYLTCYLADRHNTEIIQLTRWLITPGSLVDLEQHLGKFKLILASF